jgi:monoamine oxidase
MLRSQPEAAGEAAFVDFAVAELASLLGSDFARRVKPLGLHRWGSDPFARGSYSYALPGQAACRGALAATVDKRWSRKSEQGDKWSFCLTAGTLWPANQERP